MTKKTETISAIDRVTKHFEAHSMRKMHVPEWDMDIYLNPLSVQDMRGIGAKAISGDLDALITLLIRVARDKDGEKLFTIADKITLKNKGYMPVIKRITDKTTEIDGEEEVKNS